MGQGKAHKPTEADREAVRRAVMAGTKIDDIARFMNLSHQSIRTHYRFEIFTARETLKGKAAKVVDDALTDGNLDAAKFVLARVAGWTEKTETELTGKDGGPVQVIDPSKMSTAALAELRAATNAEPDES